MSKSSMSNEDLRQATKTVTYATVVAMLKGEGLTMSNLVAALAAKRGWDITEKEARLTVRQRAHALVLAGRTVGEVERQSDGRFVHLTAEERAKLEERRAALEALRQRVLATLAELGVPRSGHTLTDQHVTLTFEAFLELCE